MTYPDQKSLNINSEPMWGMVTLSNYTCAYVPALSNTMEHYETMQILDLPMMSTRGVQFSSKKWTPGGLSIDCLHQTLLTEAYSRVYSGHFTEIFPRGEKPIIQFMI